MRPAKKKKSHFSKRLIKLRQERGYTQEQLARALGATLSAISYYETRADNPRLNTIQTLAKFFDVPVTYFFEEEEE